MSHINANQTWASYLQAIQLVDAMGQCCPPSVRPELKPSVSARLKVIEAECRSLSQYLEKHMDTENMDAFQDKNAEMFRFMKAFHSLTNEQMERVMLMVEDIKQPKTI